METVVSLKDQLEFTNKDIVSNLSVVLFALMEDSFNSVQNMFILGTDSSSEEILHSDVPEIESALTDGVDSNLSGILSYGPDIRSGREALGVTSIYIFDNYLETYIVPCALLTIMSLIYATNFPLVAIMDETLPVYAATPPVMTIYALFPGPIHVQIRPLYCIDSRARCMLHVTGLNFPGHIPRVHFH